MIGCNDKMLIFFAFLISLEVVVNNGIFAIAYSATFLADITENVNGRGEKNTCIRCSSNEEHPENPDFQCNETGIANLGKNNTCTLQGDANECLTYQYTDENSETVIKRDCGDPKKLTCKILYDEKFDFLHICNTCENNLTDGIQICNSGKLNTIGTKCYKCNSDDKICTKDEITEKDKLETCDLDDTVHQKCIAYKYIDDKDGKYKTYRGCVPDDTNSNIEQFPNTTRNFECTDNLCNNKFNKTLIEKTVCIKCDSSNEGQSTCGEDEVFNLNKNNFCTLNENETCITYRYTNNEGKFTTIRDCVTEEDKCKTLLDDETKPLDLCYSCDEETCNRQMSINGKCYQCDGNETECNDKKIDDSKMKQCYLDPTVHTSCTGYKYIGSDGKIKTHRECSSESSFESIANLSNTITTDGLWCHENLCNNDTISTKDEKQVCIQCSSEEKNSNCGDDEVSNLNADNFCTLEKNQKCVTYRYKNDKGKQITQRDCEAPDICANLFADKNQPLDLCNICDGEACNRQISIVGKCYQCDNDDENKCSAEKIIEADKKCYLDQTVHTLCVAYKYFDDNGQIRIHRGCTDKTNLTAISKSTRTITTKNLDCKTDECNKNAINTDDEKSICIKCPIENDEAKCAEAAISGLSDKNFVEFNETDSECVVYQYIDESTNTSIIQRDMVSKTKSCNFLYGDKFDLLELCSSCNTTGCNIKKPDQNGIECYKCRSEIDSACAKTAITIEDKLGKCFLGDSVHQKCIEYKYIDGKDGKYKAYRGCAPAGTYETIKNYPNTTIAYDCDTEYCNGDFNSIPDNLAEIF